MSRTFSRKPIAVAAILASSIASALAAGGAAHATPSGSPSSPFTITTGGTVYVLDGKSTTITLPEGAHDVSWAPRGGRLAYIGDDDAIYTADTDGSHPIKIAQGNTPRRTVWEPSGKAVYWTEPNGVSVVKGAFADGSSLGTQQPTFPLFKGTLPGNTMLLFPDFAADGSAVTEVHSLDVEDTLGLTYYDANGQPQYWHISQGAGGHSPTISPDGNTIVFSKKTPDQTTQLFAITRDSSPTSWSTPKQITWAKGDHTTPVFAPDGKTVAFEYTDPNAPKGEEPPGTRKVDLADALAATAPAPGLEQDLSGASGELTVRPDSPSHVIRFAGVDRTDTAVKASHQVWRTVGAPADDSRQAAQSVVLSRDDLFADALGGAALAAHKNGPLLLTNSKTLSPETLTELQRVLPGGGTVYILGGTAAISQSVQDKLAHLGYTIQRIAGADRYTTAINIANTVDKNADHILVATGESFPDALSAGAAAGAYDSTVVVLTAGNTMPKATDDYLHAKKGAAQLTYLAAIGGAADKALKSAKWSDYDPLVGADRYQTSYMVAHRIFGSFDAVGVATGEDWPDSLSGGAMMGTEHGPLLLVDPKAGLSHDDDTLLDANRGAANWGYVFGGINALPLRIDTQLAADIATATGSTTGPGHNVAVAPKLATPDVRVG
ncbi:cell wall-binding repeat-containing protein [Catenulispora yoronensis]|uniref:cell wall-binding repeat-containing protein n=1 Tax=Catenulispora yoronensis TaxID=450799 RepID=UPI0031D31CDC